MAVVAYKAWWIGSVVGHGVYGHPCVDTATVVLGRGEWSDARGGSRFRPFTVGGSTVLLFIVLLVLHAFVMLPVIFGCVRSLA